MVLGWRRIERERDLYLITGANVGLVAINVNTVGNVGRLLLESDQQVHCVAIEA